ncbi:MAG: type 4a pilus biogenesis protein PilO [Terriglobia bacterium]
MALRFRELPWYYQLALFAAVAVLVILAGEWLDLSPVKAKKVERDNQAQRLQQLKDEVNQLQTIKQRHAEFRTRVQALQEQLARARTFVPAEKQTDEYIRQLQGAAVNTQVTLRRLTARDVVFKEFYAEIPFEVELDGAYYDLMSFFRRIGGTTRIINAGALQLRGIESGRGQYEYPPGTTVGGVCVVTTYYTPSPEELAAAAPPAIPGRGTPPRR